ncbi:hypothetical protein GCM10017786_34730 [Amycolatopsis deserti]|uniref:Uncharacterized protein n=1 Tax=Amycolatopsis deserti TaxID=185696 RepID=A0ABQ3J276_9PSEU|nr:DUF5988 family protein [Amycolatopsis deserti]GHE98827.1 hypothetical protein GCM10017786_34730 [Amycolatopsis deserti]
MSDALKIQVRLTGGPAGIPPVVEIDPSLLPDGCLKIRFAAGYEHFRLVEQGDGAPVFAWADRTRIAE